MSFTLDTSKLDELVLRLQAFGTLERVPETLRRQVERLQIGEGLEVRYAETSTTTPAGEGVVVLSYVGLIDDLLAALRAMQGDVTPAALEALPSGDLNARTGKSTRGEVPS